MNTVRYKIACVRKQFRSVEGEPVGTYFAARKGSDKNGRCLFIDHMPTGRLALVVERMEDAVFVIAQIERDADWSFTDHAKMTDLVPKKVMDYLKSAGTIEGRPDWVGHSLDDPQEDPTA